MYIGLCIWQWNALEYISRRWGNGFGKKHSLLPFSTESSSVFADRNDRTQSVQQLMKREELTRWRSTCLEHLSASLCSPPCLLPCGRMCVGVYLHKRQSLPGEAALKCGRSFRRRTSRNFNLRPLAFPERINSSRIESAKLWTSR